LVGATGTAFSSSLPPSDELSDEEELEEDDFLAFFHGFSCTFRCSALVGRLSVEPDEEADPFDDGRPLPPRPPPLVFLLRAARRAAPEAEGAAPRRDGRPPMPPVRDADDDDAGLEDDDEGVEDERVDRRFNGAEARGMVVSFDRISAATFYFQLFQNNGRNDNGGIHTYFVAQRTRDATLTNAKRSTVSSQSSRTRTSIMASRLELGWPREARQNLQEAPSVPFLAGVARPARNSRLVRLTDRRCPDRPPGTVIDAVGGQVSGQTSVQAL